MTPEAEAWFRARVHNPRTLERVLRENAGLTEGGLFRGCFARRRSRLRRVRYEWALMPKRAVIAQWGRAGWDALPPEMIFRDGKRHAAYLHGILSMWAPCPPC